LPRRFKDIDCSSISPLSPDKTRESLVLERHEDRDLLEIISARLPGKYILQVGKSSTERENLLQRFYQIFFTISILVTVLGLVSGTFMAFKALSPLRDLIKTIQEIRAGRMDARVPVRDEKGSGRDELDTLAILFNEMLQRIDILVKGMKESLDYVAHDLRTPVTRLKAVVESTLQRKHSSEDFKNALMDCGEEADRISAILSSLMDLSEAQAGVMRFDLKKQHLKPVIMDALGLYEYVAEEKNFSMTADIPCDLEVRMDRNRFMQVAANLIDNAIKYGKIGGKLEITAQRMKEDVILSFSDNGQGIPPGDIPRIFDRLYRGDKSHSKKGLGLGLCLVKAVIKGHGGSLDVKSTPGRGTTINIILPVSTTS